MSESGGNAAATLFDGPGSNVFTGQGTLALLSGAGYSISLGGFQAVVADATQGVRT